MTDTTDRAIVLDALRMLSDGHVRRDRFILEYVGEKDMGYYHTLGFFEGYELALVKLLDKHDKTWRYSADAFHCGYGVMEEFTL